MSATLSQEVSVKPPCGIHGRDGDDDGILELVRAREDDGGNKGEHFEQVLKGGFDCGERPSVLIFDFLDKDHSICEPTPQESNA